MGTLGGWLCQCNALDVNVVKQTTFAKGSGCGAVGRAVTSYTIGPGFVSNHWQLLLDIYLLLTICRKDENKEKEAQNHICQTWHVFPTVGSKQCDQMFA